MRRDLPPRPHLDHLKKQAKELLSAAQRGEREALERIRSAVPAFTQRSDEAIAALALHDAQSAIAREHGFRSWNELRTEVAKRRETPQVIRSLFNQPMPSAVFAALERAWSSESSARVARALPLLPLRNAMVVPGAVAPICVGRAPSLAAIDAALRDEQALALFTQKSGADEQVAFDSLHPVGCQALLHERISANDGVVWAIVGGVRWLSLEALRASGPYVIAEVAPLEIDAQGVGDEIRVLFESLRDEARQLAQVLPEAEMAISMIDNVKDPERLGNLVVANLPLPMDDKARYASEPTLVAKLRIASELTHDMLRQLQGE